MPEPLDSIATPFSAQAEMDVGDDVSQTRREHQDAIGNARTLDDLLHDFDKFSGSTREKGDLFERLVKRILETDPVYKQQFAKVWRWTDWPGRDGEVDAGVDLVAQYSGSDEICAIQCKFYAPGTQVSYNDAAKFILESERIGATGRIFVSTSDNIATKALRAFDDSTKPVNLLGLGELRRRDISWPDIWNPEKLVIKTERYDARPDQITARDKVIEGFKTHDRGKLILPCGTGKTYTALQIAETLGGTGGKILYLVPSIALLGQTMREWAEQQSVPHRYLGICSDVKAGRSDEDVNISTLEIPVTTDPDKLAPHLNRTTPHALTVVFSTYQSIEQVIAAQQGSTFDLVICDEAHRTTGVETKSGTGSHFLKVHNADELRANKRLYMTATPRIYSETAKNKALQIGQVSLYSMDDENIYGPEFHRMTFSHAVEQQLLTDYKVVVLTIEQAYISEVLQNAIEAGAVDVAMQHSDAAKLVGCWKALAAPEGPDAPSTVRPLQRAIAFTNTIKNSKGIKNNWPELVRESQTVLSEEHISRQHGLDVDHVDGSMNALIRSRLLDWLRASEEEAPNQCRILSNARCLTEGVDVPALDAVLFLHPRKSIVDVVQGVGRVMRRAPNKNFGYIILPVVIPPNNDAVAELDNNETYRVVWEVLQALRSHDERLDAEINQIDVNTGAGSGKIVCFGIGEGGKETSTDVNGDFAQVQQFTLPGFVIDAFHAKVVDKVGDRQYWDRWAKDVANIATTLEERIQTLIPATGETNGAAIAGVGLKFDSLLQAMRATTNDSLDENEAIGIVAEHMITEPVFEALFTDYDFANSNPVARSLNGFVALLHEHGLQAELESLEGFYASVRRRASGLDNSAARRKVLEELYENFFKHARPKVAQRLGVVYTPHEIVDYILCSADYLLREEFGKSLSDENVHILDPFAGMGTFIWRLLDSDLIREEDLERKYRHEIHANEILPLAYYMATVNIEEAFRERLEKREETQGSYEPFSGIVWRDTFNALTEGTGQQASIQFMQDNDVRANRQDEQEIGVIICNPPYSAWQRSADDANANVFYSHMRRRIEQTYALRSRAKLRISLNDHYKMAIRWATDRLPKSGGIIGLVTNASFLDGNADSGIRASLAEEFSSIFVFNLRGNARTSGEQRRREKDNVFGQGTRTPVAITLFVKNPLAKHTGCQINYLDIGDYLTREEKLKRLRHMFSVTEVKNWYRIQPDENYDWINLSDKTFRIHAPIGSNATKSKISGDAIFRMYSRGAISGRDTWIYDFDKSQLAKRVEKMVGYYTTQLNRFMGGDNFEIVTAPNPASIKWDGSLLQRFKQHKSATFHPNLIRRSSYRPFHSQFVYFDPLFLNGVYRIPSFFPSPKAENETLHLPGPGSSKPFSVILTDTNPDLHLVEGGQTFPKHTFSDSQSAPDIATLPYRTTIPSQPSSPKSPQAPNSSPKAKSSLDTSWKRSDMRCNCGNAMPCGVEVEFDGKRYVRHDNILDEALEAYQSNYDDASITKDDIFYYVYGLLHSPLYKERYQNNLRRELPHIPMAPDFWAFSKAGRALSDLHLNYETCEEFELGEERNFTSDPQPEHFQLGTSKMRWTDKETKNALRVNDYFTLGNIPPDVHRYVVNGRTPLEWLIDRYHIKTDKDSGIVHDPNKWFEETGDNIVSMIKRITHTSIGSARVIDTLPTPFTDGWTPD